MSVGMQLDLDGTGDNPEGAPRQARFQVHDAFGNPVGDILTRAGNYAWRGAEGSQTTAGLVEMQARTYDPAIGRFLQADALVLASHTTQGMNRWIYTENDPANATDPAGYGVFADIGMRLVGAGGFLMAVGGAASTFSALSAAPATGGASMYLGLGPAMAGMFTGMGMMASSAAYFETDCLYKSILHAVAAVFYLLAALSLVPLGFLEVLAVMAAGAKIAVGTLLAGITGGAIGTSGFALLELQATADNIRKLL